MVHERMHDALEKALQVEMTEAEREVQRMNFAYGTCHIENPKVTRQSVREAAKRLKERGRGEKLA
jgi:hypothetical protein